MTKVYKRQVQARKDLEDIWTHPEQVNVIQATSKNTLPATLNKYNVS